MEEKIDMRELAKLAVGGMNPDFGNSLAAMFAAAPPEIQAQVVPMPPMPPVMPMPPQQPTQGRDGGEQRVAFPITAPMPGGVLQPQSPPPDRIAALFAPNPMAMGLAAGQQYLAQEQAAAQQEQTRRQKLASTFGAA